MSNSVIVEIKDSAAWVVIDRPDVRNALDTATMRELTELIEELGRDPSVRCIVLRGGGDRVFVSGGDIREFKQAFSDTETAIAYEATAEHLHEAISRAPKPVIAMMNGHAIGGGCLLANACDFRFCSDAARLGIPISKIGFCICPPDLQRLARLVGVSQAKRLLMTGVVISASEALQIGLVERVASPETLVKETEGFVDSLVANAPLSLKSIKEMSRLYLEPQLTFEDGTPWYREVYASSDLQEGIEALSAKRTPTFNGR